MNIKFLKLFIISIFLLIPLSGCTGNTSNNNIENNTINNNTSKDNSTVTKKVENPYKITTEYDGVYSFKEYSGDSTDKIYTTIGAFLFENGKFTLNYYLNDRYSELENSTGFFGIDNDGTLKLMYNSGVVWDISVNGGKLSYSNRISGLKKVGDNIELSYVGDSSTFSQSLSALKKEIANEGLFYNNNIRWMMSNDEIDTAIGSTSPINSGSITYARKSHSKYNNPYYIKETVYVLDKKQLKAYFLDIDDAGKTYSNYEEIRDVLNSKYGTPTTEKFNWIDTEYKNMPSKWDDAFKFSDFTIKTTWNNNPDFSIILKWDYDNSCVISYCQKGYENML